MNPLSPDQLRNAAAEKVAALAKLRRDGGVLRDYRAPRWDEPFIMEQGSPGERGILVPLAEPGVTAAVGAAADYIPQGMARAAAPELPEMAQYQVMRHYLRYAQMTLGMDLGSDISEGTCTMKYSPRLHEELIRGRTRAPCRACSRSSTRPGSTCSPSAAWTPSPCSPAADRTPCSPTPASCAATSRPGASSTSAAR